MNGVKKDETCTVSSPGELNCYFLYCYLLSQKVKNALFFRTAYRTARPAANQIRQTAKDNGRDMSRKPSTGCTLFRTIPIKLVGINIAMLPKARDAIAIRLIRRYCGRREGLAPEIKNTITAMSSPVSREETALDAVNCASVTLERNSRGRVPRSFSSVIRRGKLHKGARTRMFPSIRE